MGALYFVTAVNTMVIIVLLAYHSSVKRGRNNSGFSLVAFLISHRLNPSTCSPKEDLNFNPVTIYYSALLFVICNK